MAERRPPFGHPNERGVPSAFMDALFTDAELPSCLLRELDVALAVPQGDRGPLVPGGFPMQGHGKVAFMKPEAA